MQDDAFEAIRSERLTLRRFTPPDAAALAAYRSDPEVARYQAFDGCSLDEARRFIAELEGAAPGTPGRWFQFAASPTPDGPLLGDCALRCTRADPRQAELGFSFARDQQGKGLAREAVRLLLGYAFGRLDLHRVFAIVDERNARARRLLERLGFRCEAHFVENAFFKGAWSSELLYALLQGEWQGRSEVTR